MSKRSTMKLDLGKSTILQLDSVIHRGHQCKLLGGSIARRVGYTSINIHCFRQT